MTITTIAAQIAQIVKNKPNITDIQIREDSSLFYKGPEGFVRDTTPPVTRQDIEAFFDFVTNDRPAEESWKMRIKGPQGDFNDAITLDGQVRLRINGFKWGEKNLLGASIRCQPVQVSDMDLLGVPEIMKFFLESRGLVLVTGPTGAGKSTTLAAAIEYLNKSDQPRNIITIEDPIEYEITSRACLVTQREVGTGYLQSMSDGVLSALRQNPNVIVVGEARTKETISAMMRGGGSGHLVIASMHTSSASETVQAILSVFPGEEVQVKAAALASMLVGIISQQLIPRKDKTGFVLATEVLIVNNAVRNAIRHQKYSEFTNLMSAATNTNSSYTLNHDLAEFVRSGLITPEAARAASYDPEELKHLSS